VSKFATLLDVFEPPESMVGYCVALVAMTAGEDLLDAAMERFTRMRMRQRAEFGALVGYLMLDGHTSASRKGVLLPGQVAGVHEFQPRATDAGLLLHAKLALLGFATSATADRPTHLRLAVLTANFTNTSAKRQLELVWVVDVPVEGGLAEDRADVIAAASFVGALLVQRFHRGDPALTRRLDGLLNACRELKTNRKPRFIHSLVQPLSKQIRQSFRDNAESRRNLLVCGSGFYEQESGKAEPAVVSWIVQELLNAEGGGFTKDAKRVLLVDPSEAGAVAAWSRGGATAPWEISRPRDALGQERRLHAKFIYAGYRREGIASNGWLYLGSGNLSHRGLFTAGPNQNPEGGGKEAAGNIECGVVFGVRERLDSDDIARSLFWDWEADPIGPDEWREGQVGDAPENAELIATPPILSARVQREPSGALRLVWCDGVPDDAAVSVSWMDSVWHGVAAGQESVAFDGRDAPGSLNVRDDATGRAWIVPVVDPNGRVGWRPPHFDTYAAAIAALLDFPMRPAEVAADDDDDDDGSNKNADWGGNADEFAKSYALHAAADLIERIAALQSTLTEPMVNDWLDHLERMLLGAFPDELLKSWRTYKINVFDHLKAAEFRPKDLSASDQRYDAILDRAAREWGLT
jgi:hypothetical protein